MRGRRISVRAMREHAGACRPDKLARILVRVALHVEADLFDPRPRLFAALFRADATAFETKRDVVLDGAIVERRVVLEHHPAIGAGPGDGRIGDVHDAFRRRMMRPQTSDEAKHRGLPASRRSQDRDELPVPGRSGTVNVTSRITVRSPNRLVTLRNSTMFGSASVIRRPDDREKDRVGRSTASDRSRRRAVRSPSGSG
jgi:hypothetical protein